ncbi:type I DNA topoisomerase [Vampirovibrio sp.]|uniref:type I DNA topoisomerase n=1 Tax=Vampirovibrio sp. TaxID=2717857 RepID=UPI0035945505
MAKLLIVESPGKLKTLRSILGPGWNVQPSVGHITELAHDGVDALGFDLEESSVVCRYVARGDRGKEVIQKLRAASKNADEVYLATDPDREGEAIAWHVAEQLNLSNPKRVIYSQITEQAVKAAIASPTLLDMNLINAQRCRQCLDKLVGYRVSPLLWHSTGGKSAGRVQSATLHLVCQREREIQAFTTQDYWSVWVDYQGDPPLSDEVKTSEAFTFRAFYKGQAQGAQPENTANDDDSAKDDANDDAKSDEVKAPESTKVLTLAEAERLTAIARQEPHQVIKAEGKLTTKSPPPPFITSSLQQSAGSQLGLNPEKTMAVAQSLYEGVELANGPKGLITYMRTDSVELSPEFIEQARSYLSQKDAKNLPTGKVKQHKVKESAQAAHEAIRPADVFITPKSVQQYLTPDQYGLYSMIWRRAVASQAAPAKLMKTVILTRSGSVFWEARGMMVSFPGYTFYWNNLDRASQLPTLQKGQALNAADASHEKRQTQPPSRYSEPKLVQLMEKKGIGRPSTYASTLKTLKEREYLELKGKTLHPTALGLSTDQVLLDVLPDIVSSEFTAAMESSLDDIAEGKQAWEQYLIGWNQAYLKPELEKARLAIKEKFPQRLYRGAGNKQDLAKSRTKCPNCSQLMGKVPTQKVSKGYFLKCVGTCEDVVLFWSERSKQWEAPQSKANGASTKAVEISEHPCPVCKKPLEIYPYVKDRVEKQLLRCSDAQARTEKKHADVVYFQSKGKWWSPKFGEIKAQES